MKVRSGKGGDDVGATRVKAATCRSGGSSKRVDARSGLKGRHRGRGLPLPNLRPPEGDLAKNKSETDETGNSATAAMAGGEGPVIAFQVGLWNKQEIRRRSSRA